MKAILITTQILINFLLKYSPENSIYKKQGNKIYIYNEQKEYFAIYLVDYRENKIYILDILEGNDFTCFSVKIDSFELSFDNLISQYNKQLFKYEYIDFYTFNQITDKII